MIPMSLGLGEGGEQNAPLGRAVIGGLLFATATTLFFVPVMYSLFRRKELKAVDEDAELLFEKDEPEYKLAMEGKNGRDGQSQKPPANGQQPASGAGPNGNNDAHNGVAHNPEPVTAEQH